MEDVEILHVHRQDAPATSSRRQSVHADVGSQIHQTHVWISLAPKEKLNSITVSFQRETFPIMQYQNTGCRKQIVPLTKNIILGLMMGEILSKNIILAS